MCSWTGLFDGLHIRYLIDVASQDTATPLMPTTSLSLMVHLLISASLPAQCYLNNTVRRFIYHKEKIYLGGGWEGGIYQDTTVSFSEVPQ